MPSSDSLFSLSKELLRGAPEKRKPKRIQTFGELEIETKAELTSAAQISEMIERIRRQSDGISMGKFREQFHTVFASGPDEYHGVVFIPGKTDLHVRTKQKGEKILTPDGRYPVFLRAEEKVSPNDKKYVEYMQKVFRLQKLGVFYKKCADASFWLDDLSFSATVSLVDDPQSRKTEDHCYQIELEFDGHKEGTKPPSNDVILQTLQRAADISFGDISPSTRTKLEWLVRGTSHESMAPTYEIIKPEESLLMKYRRD